MHKKTNALSALHLLFQFCVKVISSGTLLLQPLSHLLQQIRRFHVHQILMEKRHLQIQTVTDCFTSHGKLETKCHYNTICPLRQEYKRDFSLKWKMLWVIFDSPQTNVFVRCLIRRSALQKEVTLHEHQRQTSFQCLNQMLRHIENTALTSCRTCRLYISANILIIII